MDTIFAEATPPGRGGVSVIRVSGPSVSAVCTRLGIDRPPARRAVVRALKDGDEILDEALIILFESKASFTGEEVLELHLHGSPAVRGAVLGVLGSITGCRLAEPGEFTRRALENGRMDLAQVEGLADLIDAETEAQRLQAQRVFSGALGFLSEGLRADLVEALALLEVTIDFADEEVPVDVTPDVRCLLRGVMDRLNAEIAGVPLAERLRDGFEVAIVGAPNAGKSTLLNALAGRKAALTSDIPGTTRDVIEVRMDLDGLPVTFLDTAGLRDSDDQIEKMGVALARDRAKSADLRVFLGSYEPIPDVVEARPDDINIMGKGDLHPDLENTVSGTTGAGVDGLLAQIAAVLSLRVARAGTATNDRHRQAMAAAVGALETATSFLDLGDAQTELCAEEIRTAVTALASLVGRVDAEAVLDHIFSRFCLGK